jgi:hypothetical protein
MKDLSNKKTIYVLKRERKLGTTYLTTNLFEHSLLPSSETCLFFITKSEIIIFHFNGSL